MKKQTYVIGIVIAILVVVGFFAFPKFTHIFKEKPERVVIDGIENFRYEKEGNENRYLLFYPADWRVSQDYTLVKEVMSDGEVVKEYEIHDPDFRRMFIHQKPTEIDTLYISLFGEAVIQNWFYTYDVKEKSFKQMPIQYFEYETGVNHIMHFGSDILFNTIVSHKTGDQDVIPETAQFKVSFSNFTKQKSYETEYGREPSFTPILQFNGKLIYTGHGNAADLEDGIPDQRFVGFIDEETGERYYKNFGFDSEVMFSPFYATEEYAYIIAETGELIVIDVNFNETIYKPFDDISYLGHYHIEDGGSFLFIDKELALFTHYDHDENQNIIGLLSFNGDPTFTMLDKNYINESSYYRFLYQDVHESVVYLIERKMDSNDGYLLIINNETFDLIERIPIEYEHLLDMVIKQ